MAENTIDTLSLEINSDAGQAVEGIDKLANSLLNLKKGMSGFNKKGFGNLPEELRNLNSALMGVDAGKILSFSTAIKGLGESIRTLSGIENLIIPATNNLEKISKLDFSKLKIGGDFSGLGSLSSGINDFALAATNLGKIQPKEINRTVAAFEKLGKIDVSGMENSFKSLNGIDVTAFKNLGTAFNGLMSSLSGSEKVHANVAKIVNSISQLTASAGNIPIVSTELPRLKNELSDFIATMSAAPSVQPGTVSIVSALAQISNAGTKAEKVSAALPGVTVNVKQFIEELSKAPAVDSGIVRTVESLGKLVDVGGRAGTAANKLQGQVSSLSVTMGKLRGGTSGAVGGLKSFTKQILSVLGISGGIYTLVRGIKTAISTASDLVEVQNVVNMTFGDMKQKVEDLASTSIQDFGMSELTAKQISSRFQAMGVAMGFAQDEMSDMSIELTKLAADMASFYNVEQEEVAESLESIFTGQTRPLRAYGLDLTQATLQEWALKQGIDANIQSMSQAEKTLLRYQYVMANTTAAQKDFSKTSMTWANQIRMLGQQFQQLGGIVGGVLINAFKPFISALNSVMQSVIKFAKTVANALGAIFGWTFEINSGGLATDFEAAGAGAEEMEQGTGGAAKNLKDMNKYIAAWHEVNNMSSENDSGGGGGAGSGGGISDLSFPENYSFKVEAEDQVSPVLEKIKKRYVELKKLFLKGFKVGLGDVGVFDSITKSLGSIRDNLVEIFTDKNVISSFNKMLDTLVYNAGIKVGSFVSIGASIVDNILGGVSIYLDEAKEKIKQWLINMFDITAQVDTIKTNFINALGNIFTVFRSDSAKELTASIIQIFADAFFNISELAAKLGRDILGLVLNPITENAEGIKTSLLNTITPLGEAMGTIADSLTVLWEKVQSVYDNHIKPMLDSFQEGISGIVGSLLDGYNTHISPVLSRLEEKFTQVWDGTIHPLLENFIGLFGDVADLIKAVWENALQPVVNWIAQNIMPVVAPVLEGMGSLFLDTFQTIGQLFDGFITAARGVIQFLTASFNGDWEKAWECVKATFKGIWDSMPDFVKGPIRSIIGFVNKMIEGIESGINYVVRAINGLSFDIPDWVPGIGGETFGFNVNEISLGRVPMLANGGVVKKATLALVGESGQEAVLPLERNTQWMDDLSRQITKNISKFGNL